MMKKIFTQIFVSAMLIGSFSVQAQDGLFISELCDPADEYTGRFVELYNAGSETVDFGSAIFYLSRQSNGGTSWGEVQLTGSIAPGKTYVIGGSAFESHYGFAPNLLTGILTGNGDDAYSLYEGGGHDDGSLHDIYGEINEDGTDEPWEYTDSRAVRTDDVDDPRILWSASEWTITTANIADCNPGTHLGSTSQNPIVPAGSLIVVSDTVEWGQTIEVAIATGELTSEDNIISFQFDLSFDEDILEYEDYSIAGMMSDGGTLAINASLPGKISLSYMSPTPLIGIGNIVVLKFNPSAMGSTSLSLSNALLNNTPVQEVSAGTILIAEVAPPSGYFNYSDTVNRYSEELTITAVFSETMSTLTPIQIDFNGAVSATGLSMIRTNDTTYTYTYTIPDASGDVNVSFSNGTDLWNNALLANPTKGGSFNITAFNMGDVNDDGDIHAFDAALTLQYSVAIDPLPELDPLPWENWRKLSADVDKNGNITAYDAGLILQYSADIIDNFPSSGKKSLLNADVRIEIIDNELVFFSSGNLIGLNISCRVEENVLGTPILLDKDFLSEINISESNYKIGLCTDTAPSDDSPILKIPVSKSIQLVFELTINDRIKNISVNPVSIMTDTDRTGIIIYPNPVIDMLSIKGLCGPTIYKIYNVNGDLLVREIAEDTSGEINVSMLKSGMYILSLEWKDKRVTRKFTVK